MLWDGKTSSTTSCVCGRLTGVYATASEGHTNLRSSSSDKLVLMDEATEEIVPSNPPIKCRTWKRIRPRLRHLQIETSVGPGLVVVSGVGSKHPLQVAAAEHEHPVQALGPDGTDPSLGERVRSRSPDRGPDDAHAF